MYPRQFHSVVRCQLDMRNWY